MPRSLMSEGRIGAVLQPVVLMQTGTILGYEALARPFGDRADLDVAGMFVAAQRLGIARELDAVCIDAAIAASAHIPADALLFIKVGVAALLEPERDADHLRTALHRVGRDATTVVLELSESINDLSRFDDAFTGYRAAGIRFALDDVGHAHSTLEAFAAVNPEFVKVSPRLTTALDSPSTHATLRGIVAFAHLNGATVIAAGLEDAGLIPTLIALGVTGGEGTAFGGPAWPGGSELRLTA
jgi:EAL domain-containing protein (putative c-di-GMP-specific phosphodiesterase class I)